MLDHHPHLKKGAVCALATALTLGLVPAIPQQARAASSGTWHGVSYDIDDSGTVTFHAGTFSGDFAEDDQFCEHEGLEGATSVRADGTIVLPEDSSCLFQNSENLRSIDLEGFDSTQVTDMDFLFDGCASLESIEFSGFDTTQATTMEGLFSNCASIGELDLSGFDTSWTTDMDEMFSGCSKLAYIDLTTFDTGQVTEMEDAFQDCDGLLTVSLGEDFSFSGAGSARLCSLPDGSWTSVDGKSYQAGAVPDRVETTYSRGGQPIADQSKKMLTKLKSGSAAKLPVKEGGDQFTVTTKRSAVKGVDEKKKIIYVALQRVRSTGKVSAMRAMSGSSKSKKTFKTPKDRMCRNYKVSWCEIYPNAFKGEKNITTVIASPTIQWIRRFAFRKSSVKKLILQTRRLQKKRVVDCLKKSKMKEVRISVGSKKQSKRYRKMYRKFFSKAIVGKKVKIA